MNLVVVESPSKAKTINKYLGKEYLVKASKGHIIDLPKSTLGIDVENNFKPQYEIKNAKSLAEIKKAFKSADKLILAVDLDREGEAIGWHIAKELKLVNDEGKKIGKKPIERIVFHEISKDAIQDALNSPRAIDINLVNSQQARRLLDRIVGYKLSPLLWKKISFGLSAGRVQSVAVRLIVEREEERNKFKADEYWTIEANLAKKKHDTVSIKYQKSSKEVVKEGSKQDENVQLKQELIPFNLSKIDNKKADIKEEKDTKKIVEFIKDKKWILDLIESNVSTRNPKPPFITSTLQQTSVNWLGFSAKRTMQIAQKLYEAGYITYMRTDSVFMSATAVNEAYKYVNDNLGQEYLPDTQNAYKSSNKSAQEAHECIRPVHFYDTSSKLGLEGDEKKVYDLIWKRALGSLMKPARIENIALVVKIDKYEFRANGKRVLFDGFLKIYPEKFNEVILPKLEKGVELYPHTIQGTQHFTQPPARYSEASLIKKMEELGIGRPSTYASIISTIQDRKYVINENKYLRPTDMGNAVNSMLTKYFDDIVDYNFTAEMENKLDKIAEGKLEWIKMLKDFYGPFDKEITTQDKKIKRGEFTELGKSDEKCPECGKPMLVKLGRYGRFLSCSDYPKCKGILRIENPDDPQGSNEAQAPMDMSKYELAPKTEDGREFLLKTGRFGSFWAHPDYPKVKDAKPLMLKEKCPECGNSLVERKGKWGSVFIGCSTYPNCKYLRNVKKQKAGEAEEVEVARSVSKTRKSKR